MPQTDQTKLVSPVCKLADQHDVASEVSSTHLTFPLSVRPPSIPTPPPLGPCPLARRPARPQTALQTSIPFESSNSNAHPLIIVAGASPSRCRAALYACLVLAIIAASAPVVSWALAQHRLRTRAAEQFQMQCPLPEPDSQGTPYSNNPSDGAQTSSTTEALSRNPPATFLGRSILVALGIGNLIPRRHLKKHGKID